MYNKSTKHITCITKQKLKLFEGKLDFWNSFENWSLRDYLHIGVLEIIWKLDFYELNVRMRILKIKFEEILKVIWEFGI